MLYMVSIYISAFIYLKKIAEEAEKNRLEQEAAERSRYAEQQVEQEAAERKKHAEQQVSLQ